MNSLYALSILLAFLLISNVMTSGFKSFAVAERGVKAVGLRAQSVSLIDQLSGGIINLSREERKSLKKYLDKLVEAYDTCKKPRNIQTRINIYLDKSSSSKKIKNISEVYEKYSEKLKEFVVALSCSPEGQVSASEAIEKFLKDFKDSFDDDNEKVDKSFLKALEAYPAGSIASHYVDLWKSLNAYSEHDFDKAEMSRLILGAFHLYDENFKQTFHRDLGQQHLDNEDFIKCNFVGMYNTHLRCGEKIARLVFSNVEV